MAYKSFNMIALFLNLMVVGTIIASPIGKPTKSPRGSLLHIAMESINNNSPRNHSYLNGTLLEIKKFMTRDSFPIYEVSLRLLRACIEESPCPREICKMLIKNESNRLIVDDQSKECHDDKNEQNYDLVDNIVKNGTIKINVMGKKIRDFISNSADQLNEYIRFSNPMVTTMANATKEKIPDGTKYVIYLDIVEPTCIITGIKTSCSMNAHSLATLCRIIVNETIKTKKIIITQTTVTCESKKHGLKRYKHD